MRVVSHPEAAGKHLSLSRPAGRGATRLGPHIPVCIRRLTCLAGRLLPRSPVRARTLRTAWVTAAFMILGVFVCLWARVPPVPQPDEQTEFLLDALFCGTRDDQAQARESLRSRSSVAVPALLARLRRLDEGAIHRRLRRWSLEFPFLRHHFGRYLSSPPTETWRDCAAVSALGDIGPAATGALPLLRRFSREPSSFGIAAKAAAMRIRGQSIAPTIQALQFTGAGLWEQNAMLVGWFGSDAEAAVPALCKELASGGRHSHQAADAAGQIGRKPELAVPALIKAYSSGSCGYGSFFTSDRPVRTAGRVGASVSKTIP